MVRVKRVTQVKPGAPVVSAKRPAEMAPITPPTSIGVDQTADCIEVVFPVVNDKKTKEINKMNVNNQDGEIT